tara:strand:+ start:473 stop:895 length:423 start_codon:yes stop_codon:yes gene_type:complete
MKKNKKQMPLQNGEELKPIMIKPNMGRMIKPMAKFPDLSGDGKVTQKDILMGRGVIKKPKVQKTKANIMKGITISATDPKDDLLKEAKRQGTIANRLYRQGDIKGAEAAKKLSLTSVRQAADIDRSRIASGKQKRQSFRY